MQHIYTLSHDREQLHKLNIQKLPDLQRVLSDFLINPDNKDLVSIAKQENYWFD